MNIWADCLLFEDQDLVASTGLHFANDFSEWIFHMIVLGQLFADQIRELKEEKSVKKIISFIKIRHIK